MYIHVCQFLTGYHNYHHSYPSDYQCSEDGHGLNATKHMIDFMASLGQAYNLRTASKTVIQMSRDKVEGIQSKKRQTNGS